MPINRDQITQSLQGLSHSWRRPTPSMEDHLRGAKAFAISLLVLDGASFIFAEQCCEDAIQRGQLAPAPVLVNR